jgi:thioredoxin-related protein
MRLLFILTVNFICCSIFAQVNFTAIPLQEAMERSKSEGKLIFLQFEAAGCDQCNDVANKGFEK